ncbi:MAG: AmmeMemoRadiSam system radical SAM enzyme [Lachnospiraceae bacterium]|nr:AmmeMemoRadiSam system radical SAM enzyme [Lachnospiraceae bacterium]
MAQCDVCFRHCEIKENGIGFCRARGNIDGKIKPLNYGRITSFALDPIEKKPLRNFYPGSRILSVGSYGCNLRCPFCQNNEISWGDEVDSWPEKTRVITPEDIVEEALYYKNRGNIGVAYTYNEPLVGYEFVRDTAKLVHDAGMVNVVVTAGGVSLHVLEELSPYIDAMNIDIKAFSESYYKDFLKSELQTVIAFITAAVKVCHVELTTLIVPGKNDSDEEMRALSSWISSLTDSCGNSVGNEIPLHVSRFFPTFRYTEGEPTEVSSVYHLAEVAREKLKHVYTGNC